MLHFLFQFKKVFLHELSFLVVAKEFHNHRQFRSHHSLILIKFVAFLVLKEF